MIPEGTFQARATEAALGESGTGNPQIAVCFELLDDGYQNQTITWYGSFSKNQGAGKKTPFQRTIESLRACGWQGDDLSNLSGIDENEVSIVIEHEEYPEGSGVIEAKVKWVNRGGGLALKAPMSPEAAKAFAARMKGEVIAASRGAGKPANGGAAKKKTAAHPNAPGNGPGIGDDDIPF